MEALGQTGGLSRVHPTSHRDKGQAVEHGWMEICANSEYSRDCISISHI